MLNPCARPETVYLSMGFGPKLKPRVNWTNKPLGPKLSGRLTLCIAVLYSIIDNMPQHREQSWDKTYLLG